MAIEIRPFTSEHVEAMKAFNRRLAQGGISTSRNRPAPVLGVASAGVAPATRGDAAL